jgi:hypothetical protein
VNAVPIGVPLPFAVQAIAANGVAPAANITVTFTVTKGKTSLGCGTNICTAITGSDSMAAIMVTPTTTALAAVTASVANGASVTTEFIGAKAPSIAALNGTLYLAQGAIFNWTPQALALSNALPYPGQNVNWVGETGAAVASATSLTNANGVAWTQVTAGPLAAGSSDATVYACLSGSMPGSKGCAYFTIIGDDPSTASLTAVSGNNQTLAVGDPIAPVMLQVTDVSGNPLAGAVVNFYETLRQWEPPCPASGDCPTPPVLAAQTVQAISDSNGMVALTPLSDGTAPTQLDAQAVTGSSATMAISIERNP